MLKPIRSILFATDLSSNCQQALDFTISVATRFQATIYMLHVIEELPEHMSERLKDLLGTHEWAKLVESHKKSAHKSLIGKTSSNAMLREAIYNFCKNEGIGKDSCSLQSREIIISRGEVVENILGSAEKNNCDMIVLGGHHSLFSSQSLGTTVKNVLKKSKIPVTIVPVV